MKQKDKFEQLQPYWNTYHCRSKVYLSERRPYGRYCKNRRCTLCLSIRKADIIKLEWLKMCPEHLAKPYAQKISQIWNKETAMIEAIKYGSKIFTELDVNNKSNKKLGGEIYAAALDYIFCAMKGHRIFDRFGFTLQKKRKEGKATLLTNYKELNFDAKACDWIGTKDGNKLFGYVADQKLLAILENHQ